MKRILVMGFVMVLVAIGAVPAAAGGASTDQVTDVPTGLPVSFDPLIVAAADCKFVKRVQLPDGSAIETQNCDVTGLFTDFFVTPFQGRLPHAFVEKGGGCEWSSDYWWTVLNEPVYADSFRYTVTPSGKISVQSTYPAVPLDCS